MPARPLGEPVADQPGLVGRVVVHHQVDLEVLGHIGLDLVEELAELGGPVARQALADHLAGGDVQGGEQRGDAMTLVIVAAARRLRSEEHTSELQSLMRNSYAVFCLKKKNRRK